MPGLTIINISLLAAMLLLGLIVGWILRARRCGREKIAVSAGWQAQMDSQQSEHDRLAGQNKSLMEQISQYQASNKDTVSRARELSVSVKEVTEGRDELQRQLKDVRRNLEIAIAKRDRVQNDLAKREAMNEAGSEELRKRDEKILKLNSALQDWQDRVPPLVARFRERDEAANQLDGELREAQQRIAELEESSGAGSTRMEPADAESLPPDLAASNEPHDDTAATEITRLHGHLADGGHDVGHTDSTLLQRHLPDAGPEFVDDLTAEASHEHPADSDGNSDAEAAPEAAADDDPGDAAVADRYFDPGDTSVLPADPDEDAGEETNLVAVDDAEHDKEGTDEPDTGLADDPVADPEAAGDDAGDDGDKDDSDDDNDDSHDVPEDDSGSAGDGDWASDTRVELTSGNWWEHVPEPVNQDPNAALQEGHDDTQDPAAGLHAAGYQTAANEHHDDLKQIKGVGPSIEKTLNDLGICRFNQIAEISEYDIDRVAQHLRGFRSRIYREDWIGQARSLHYQKNNDPN